MTKRLLNGLEYVQMDDKWIEEARKRHGMYKHGIVRILPDRYLYPGRAPYFLDKIYHFQYRPDDIVIMTFPKCGTTWMQEIIWTMVNNPDLTNPEANTPILLRSLDISQDMLHDGEETEDMDLKDMEDLFRKTVPDKDPSEGMFIEMLRRKEGRRIIKTHFPLSLMTPGLLDKVKVVYVCRNPKDALVSGYHFARVLKLYRFKGTVEEYVKECLQEEVVFNPYWPHVKEAWKHRHHPNMHFVFYEDMKNDIMKELKGIAAFIGASLTDKQMENVAKHTSFSAMNSRGDPISKDNFKSDLKDKPGQNVFMRKGQIGDWKNAFSPELNARVDKWIEDNTKDTDIKFFYGH